ncbi:MAG: serine hydrolase domain-containing protein [Panacagrimonas sp.]
MAMKNALDAVLKRAADAGDVPGVVAAVTNREGLLYEGAFGKRAVNDAAPMNLDSMVLIASMTKAITSTAAMQLVELGKLDLDSPASKWLPDLGKAQVIEGFDPKGQPRLRAPKRAITVKHLLTHTAGFSYEFLSDEVAQFQAATGTPGFASSAYASIQTPLLFDPGERWSYGVNIDWVGLLVEQASGKKLGAYLAEHIMAPLGMTDTAFTMRPDMRARRASIHTRGADGSLTPIDLEIPQQPEVEMGGHALYGTAGDYAKFMRMILNRGQAAGGRVLKAETVEMMSSNQIGALNVESLKTSNRFFSNDMNLPPDNPHKWGLGFMINTKDLPTGRKGGSLMWAGLCNSYYWIDPVSGIAGVYLTQILPFADVKSFPLFLEFEYTTYQSLNR